MQLTECVLIDRSPAEVFPWLTVPAKQSVWLSHLVVNEHFPDAEDPSKTRFRQVFRAGFLRVHSTGEITNLQQDRLLELKIHQGGTETQCVYALSAESAGTSVSQNLSVARRASLLGRVAQSFASPLFKFFARRTMRRNLAKLKAACETTVKSAPEDGGA